MLIWSGDAEKFLIAGKHGYLSGLLLDELRALAGRGV